MTGGDHARLNGFSWSRDFVLSIDLQSRLGASFLNHSGVMYSTIDNKTESSSQVKTNLLQFVTFCYSRMLRTRRRGFEACGALAGNVHAQRRRGLCTRTGKPSVPSLPPALSGQRISSTYTGGGVVHRREVANSCLPFQLGPDLGEPSRSPPMKKRQPERIVYQFATLLTTTLSCSQKSSQR
jgi:hypothetical protein